MNNPEVAPGGKPEPSFRRRVRARIARMNQAAAELTKELGLPQEDKYEVLAVTITRRADQWTRKE